MDIIFYLTKLQNIQNEVPSNGLYYKVVEQVISFKSFLSLG